MKKNTDTSFKVFSGTSHPELSEKIAKKLGITLGEVEHIRFQNGEVKIFPLETVRGKDIFIIQTARTGSVDADLMELFVFIDAMRRAAAGRICAIIPFLPYMRQDRKTKAREPITGRLVADLLKAAGADYVLTMTLHSDQEQGFFSTYCDNKSTKSLFIDYVKKNKMNDPKKFKVVAPDLGGVAKAGKFAESIGLDFAIVNKRRHSAKQETTPMHLVGDVTGMTCIMYDDMIDTAGTACEAAKFLKDKGAKDVYMMATHGIFSGAAIERLKNSEFKKVVVTDTIPVPKEKHFKQLEILSVAGELADSIMGIHNSSSVKNLVEHP